MERARLLFGAAVAGVLCSAASASAISPSLRQSTGTSSSWQSYVLDANGKVVQPDGPSTTLLAVQPGAVVPTSKSATTTRVKRPKRTTTIDKTAATGGSAGSSNGSSSGSPSSTSAAKSVKVGTPTTAPEAGPGVDETITTLVDPSTLPQGIPDSVWLGLRMCESHNHYDINTGNGYYGAYQFAAATWRSLGYKSLPHKAAPAVQDEAARRLQAKVGWGAWPACARKLGLR